MTPRCDGRSRAVKILCALTIATGAAVAGAAAASQPPVEAWSALRATIYPSQGTLDQFNPLDLTLLIQNPTNRIADVTRIRLLAPRYVTLRMGSTHAVTIPARGAVPIPLKLVTSVAIPGTYSLVVAFDARLRGSGAWAPAVIQSQIVIGIPGVSDAMQFLGIPSLLLLPGLLMIIAFTTVFAAMTRRAAADLKQPSILVLAVTLSFVAALLYPKIAPRNLGISLDYLRGYDFWAVLYLWIFSILLGVIGGGGAAAIVTSRKRLLQPREDDTPLDVLRKLYRHRIAGFKLVQLRRRAAADAPPGAPMLALPFGNAGAGQLWLVPRAHFRRAANTERAQQRVDEIEAALERAGDDRSLLQLVAQGASTRPPQIALAWDNDENSGPRLVDGANYISAGEAKVAFLRAD